MVIHNINVYTLITATVIRNIVVYTIGTNSESMIRTAKIIHNVIVYTAVQTQSQ